MLTVAFCVIAANAYAGKPQYAEFTVEETSTIPKPEKSDYPDCYCSILCSLPAADRGQIILLIKVFENYKYTDAAAIKPGDKIRASIIPSDDLPESEKSIQQSDTLERYDLDVFAALEISRIKEFSPHAPRGIKTNRGPAKSKGAPRIAAEIEERIKHRISDELAIVNRQISMRHRHGIKPIYDQTAMERIKTFKTTNDSSDLLYWKGDSIVRIFQRWELLSAQKIKLTGQGINVITEFDRELKKRNIRLICISFPEPWELYLPVYCTNVSPLQSFSMKRLMVLQKLLENGVESIDLGFRFKQLFRQYPYFTDIIANDSHPSDHGVEVLVDLLAERLACYDFSEFQYKDTMFHTRKIINSKKLSYPAGNDKFTGKYLVKNWSHDIPKKEIRSSPVFVMGDSFSVTPWGTTGLRGALGHRMRMIVDGYQNQSGATRIMRTISGRKYRQLDGKSVVIYIISPLEWDSDKWEPLVTHNPAAGEQNVLWDLENSFESLKKYVNIKKSDRNFILYVTKDAEVKGNDYYSDPVSVKIPEKHLRGKGELFIEAQVIASRLRVVQTDGKNKVISASAPTGYETIADTIFFKADKKAVINSENNLIFRFKCNNPNPVTLTNIKILVK